jgi:hypothetical protein
VKTSAVGSPPTAAFNSNKQKAGQRIERRKRIKAR